MNKFINFSKVLCLSPHPDDVEYSMAGIVLKYPDTHFDIVCLTQGGDCDTTTGTDRLQEVVNAWKQSKSSNYTLHFTDVKFLKEKGIDQWVHYIETNFLYKDKYDCIMTPSEFDSHFEHKLVCELSYPLTRVSRLSLIEYCSPSSLENWVPDMFIDVEDVYDTKLQMLQEFKSQLGKSYFTEKIIKGFHTNFRCQKRGINLVEQFKVKQILL